MDREDIIETVKYDLQKQLSLGYKTIELISAVQLNDNKGLVVECDYDDGYYYSVSIRNDFSQSEHNWGYEIKKELSDDLSNQELEKTIDRAIQKRL